MKSLACVAALAGALLAASAHAETLYVIDQLIVSVSSSADDTGERVATIHSGDGVEVLEQHDAYAHVRLASGAEGWVKSSYLSPQLPLQQKLTSQLQELERLKQEVARLQGAASRLAPSAMSSTTGTVRSAFASPPAPVVSWPMCPHASGNVSSEMRAACPPTRSWISTTSASRRPSFLDVVAVIRPGCP